MTATRSAKRHAECDLQLSTCTKIGEFKSVMQTPTTCAKESSECVTEQTQRTGFFKAEQYSTGDK